MYLRCGVPLEAESCIDVAHAAAVVDDLDECAAGILDDELDIRCAGIHGVLEQFFHCRCGTVDHLTSGNLVGDTVGEYVDDVQGSKLKIEN